eukprot:COSAG04_NODE_4941_length_1813_cov_21.584014_1_plen_340_part_00
MMGGPAQNGLARLVVVVAAAAALPRASSDGENQLPDQEVEWLRSFYESTGGAHWIHNEGWTDAAGANWDPASVNPCSPNGGPGGAGGGWLGVTCKGQGDEPKPWNVLVIEFAAGAPGMPFCSGNNLTGHLPPSFSGVSQLTTFKVSGPVPACAGSPVGYACNPDHPENMCLAGIGQLAGELPTQLPQNIGVFGVTDTHISGTLPSSLPASAMVGPGLENLLLGRNRLTGTIPWGSVPATLSQLFLDDNQGLIGTLAEDVFPSDSSLTDVGLSGTQLSGAVPRLPASLAHLQLHKNAMTVFPDYLENLVNLQELELSIRYRGAGAGATIPAVTGRRGRGD